MKSTNKYIYKYPEQYAQDIISSFKLTLPIDLIEICNKLNIKINYEDLDEIDALLIVGKGKRNIIINSQKTIYKVRERFTIAHEIGHYIIPWHDNLQHCDKIVDFKSDDTIEEEANKFASELLVPKKLLLEDIKNKKITLGLIKSLAERYQVSLIVMARKILEYTNDEAIALFYYPNGKKYIQMQSASFTRTIKDGRITKSSADKLLSSYKASTEIKTLIDSDIWFDDITPCKIIEESMFQNNFGRVFTLLRVADQDDIFDLEWDF